MYRFDDLDVKILRELGSPSSPQWNVRVTYSAIARRIGADEETVRRRLKRAEETGAFPGWKMMPNPRLMGCGAAGLDLDVRDEGTKAEVIEKVRHFDGVIKILSFRGTGLQITLYHKDADSLKGMVERIRSASGSEEPTVWRLGFPRPEVRMTATDWQIVGAMLGDARRSLEAVSREVGVSTRTVERRLTMMSEGRALYLQGTPVFGRHAGLSCVFLVFCPDPRKKEAVDEAVLSQTRRVDLANTNSEQHSTFVMVYDNLSEADDVLDWMRSLDGVKKVKMGIMRELIVVQDWLKVEIDKKTAVKFQAEPQ